jgi:hypothetical protein
MSALMACGITTALVVFTGLFGVYCHAADQPWPGEAELAAEVKELRKNPFLYSGFRADLPCIPIAPLGAFAIMHQRAILLLEIERDQLVDQIKRGLKVWALANYGDAR